MAKNPNQLGATTIWDGPLSEVGRPLSKGNSRNCMQILKAPTPYSPGPAGEARACPCRKHSCIIATQKQ